MDDSQRLQSPSLPYSPQAEPAELEEPAASAAAISGMEQCVCSLLISSIISRFLHQWILGCHILPGNRCIHQFANEWGNVI
jgi:hypothetical protein